MMVKMERYLSFESCGAMEMEKRKLWPLIFLKRWKRGAA
jgi:hypothetical protein